MSIVTIILNAAKAAHVSGALLLAICGHESNNFTLKYNANDNGSPSHGICQVKLATARMLGFKGTAKELMNDKMNARFSAMYLKYQQNRYSVIDKMTDKMNDKMTDKNRDWIKLTAAYNAGSYVESQLVPKCPKNLRYIRLVQKKLPTELQYKLNCGRLEVKENH